MEAITISGAMCLMYDVWYIRQERKAHKAAARKALLRSTEQVIQAVLLEKRYSTKGGK